MPAIRFLYFDLGNVLVHFTRERMCSQMGEVAGVDPEVVHNTIFEGRLQQDYELGRISSQAFFESFCRQTASRPDFEALSRAAADIFSLNESLVPVVTQLRRNGHRLGILSNTCEMHWEHLLRRFPILRENFDVQALSYRIGAMKPDRAIFDAAVAAAGVEAAQVFFTDDIPGHVAGACTAGLDAVLYVSTPQLIEDLRRRGIGEEEVRSQKLGVRT